MVAVVGKVSMQTLFYVRGVAYFIYYDYFCRNIFQKNKKQKNMIDVKQTLQDSEEKMEMAALYLEEELNRIRAGRANVTILDCVRVESYGSKVPLNQVASVSVPDARTIAI